MKLLEDRRDGDRPGHLSEPHVRKNPNDPKVRRSDHRKSPRSETQTLVLLLPVGSVWKEKNPGSVLIRRRSAFGEEELQALLWDEASRLQG